MAVAQATGVAPTFDGRYRLTARIGRGGMGTVYAVVDEPTGQKLALKQLGGAGTGDPRRDELRFKREFHTLARLRHPGVVEAYDYGVDRGLPYYTMELLDGDDLRRIAPAPVGRALELLRDLAGALAFLHSKHVVHRDVTSTNVRITADGRAKLIDFGVLSTPGVVGEVAGTPSFIAPEMARGLPIDHRADLFSLGAVAYHLLTGRHAYPARSLRELSEAWGRRPAPPPAIVEGIPEPVGDLVMSLLSLDPLGRPGSAAEVIDRLGAITGVDVTSEVEVARGWLASASLAGRHSELERMRECVRTAQAGDGCTVVVEAPSGMGKSRLLRELELEAQLAGATVCRAESEAAGRGPYGVLRALVRELLARAPREAEGAATPYAPVITRVFPELAERLDSTRPILLEGEPVEQRMRLQEEIVAWLLSVARKRPLAVVVDDLQRCDEASAAAIASLARRAEGHPVLVAVGVRTDEPARAADAIGSLRRVSEQVELAGLSADDVTALARGLFGDTPHLDRLGAWMHAVAGGSPLHCTELARQLVDDGVIRYAEGVWVVPEELGLEHVPRELSEAMDARVARLPSAARALGEALAILEHEASLELVVRLADTRQDQTFDAIDALVAEGVLLAAGYAYRFRHDGLHEALLRGIDDARRTGLHLRVGTTLAERGPIGPEHEAKVGWHLYRGGQHERGTELLRRAAERLYDTQSFGDAIEPLRIVIAEGQARGRPSLAARHMMVTCAISTDRAVALEYTDETLDVFHEYTGVALAARVGRILGKHLGLAVALGIKSVGWLVSPSRWHEPNPVDALRRWFLLVGYATGLYALLLRFPEQRRLVALLEPVAVLKNRIPYAAYLFTRAMHWFSLGHWGRVEEDVRRILDIVDRDRLTPTSDIDRRTGQATAWYMLVTMYASHGRTGPYQHAVDKMREQRLKFFELQAAQAQVVIHRTRGEEAAALEVENRVEELAVRLGALWTIQAQRPLVTTCSYGLTGDVLGLKRSIEDLETVIAEGHRFEPMLGIARGEYHRERGELAESRAALERAIGLLDPEERTMRQIATGALAETLVAAGDHARAREVAEGGVALGRDENHGHRAYLLRSLRALGLAVVESGDHVQGRRILEEAIVEHEDSDLPLGLGLLHEAAARAAMLDGDLPSYRRHFYRAESFFTPTKNPALLSRLTKLEDDGRRVFEVTSESATDDEADVTVAEPISGRSVDESSDVLSEG